MEPSQILNLLLNAPLTAVLFYFLIREQKEHAETRRRADEERRSYWTHASALAERVVAAVDRLDLPGPM